MKKSKSLLDHYKSTYKFRCNCFCDDSVRSKPEYPAHIGEKECVCCGKKSFFIKDSSYPAHFIFKVYDNQRLNSSILHLWRDDKEGHYEEKVKELRNELRLLISNAEKMLELISCC